MLIVSIVIKLSEGIANVFTRKFDPAGVTVWARLHKVIRKTVRKSNMLRKALNSSEFIFKIVKFGHFIAQKIMIAVN